MPFGRPYNARQSGMALKAKRRTEACEKYLSGVEKKKRKKQGSLLTASTIGSHGDKVRRARDSDNLHPTSEEERQHCKRGYRGYQGLRYKLTEMENRKTHLSSPALQRRHIRIVRPYLKGFQSPTKVRPYITVTYPRASHPERDDRED